MPVPKEAVLRQDGQPGPFVAQVGKARLRQVEVGLIDHKHIEVLRGVQPEDQVVVFGQNLLNQATPVTIAAK